VTAENPTSSVNPPIESNSVETVAETNETPEKIEFKIEGGLKVDKRSKANWLLSIDPQFQNNKTAVKCSGCQMLTSHVVLMVHMYFYTEAITEDKPQATEKRIVGCQNCGKISSK